LLGITTPFLRLPHTAASDALKKKIDAAYELIKK
jgi:hypothetical protein